MILSSQNVPHNSHYNSRLSLVRFCHFTRYRQLLGLSFRHKRSRCARRGHTQLFGCKGSDFFQLGLLVTWSHMNNLKSGERAESASPKEWGLQPDSKPVESCSWHQQLPTWDLEKDSQQMENCRLNYHKFPMWNPREKKRVRV